MLTAAEQEELTLLRARAYGRSSGAHRSLTDEHVERLRELEHLARTADRAQAPADQEPEPGPASDPDLDPANGSTSADNGRGPSRRRVAIFTTAALALGLQAGIVLGTTLPALRTAADIPELRYAATGEDKFPIPEAMGLLDADTVRYVAFLDDSVIYIGRQPDQPDEVCLAVVQTNTGGNQTTAQCGAADVTAQASDDTWVVIGQPDTTKMNNIVLARFDARQLSPSVTAYVLRD